MDLVGPVYMGQVHIVMLSTFDTRQLQERAKLPLTDGSVAPHVHYQGSERAPASLAVELPNVCSDLQFGYESSLQLQSVPLPSGARQSYLAPPNEPRLPSDPAMPT